MHVAKPIALPRITNLLRRARIRHTTALVSCLLPAIAIPASMPIAPRAEACGCVSPPEISEGDFAVAQSGEQILFEVGEGTITAHVLIRYSGSPESFAWMVPVPAVPEFDLTPAGLFALIERSTAPAFSMQYESRCAQQAYRCATHPSCDDDSETNWTEEEDGSLDTFPTFDMGVDPDGDTPGDIDILKMEQVGDYEAIVFRADEAQNAVAWLKTNGFVVNDTMTPYMQPYLDAKMAFVAIRLVPGAQATAIRPLKMTFAATSPMIPLKLTAVAADPHLAVTAYIFGGSGYRPTEQTLVELDEAALDQVNGATNYPALVSRSIDAVGGAAFVQEYVGELPAIAQNSCCSEGENDWCDIGGDGLCQCPTADFDAFDCADYPEIKESYLLYDELRTKHTHVTRLLTRLSPEEMNFDPVFVADTTISPQRLTMSARTAGVNGCENEIAPVHADKSAQLTKIAACADLYCDHGQCVATTQDLVGCACDEGFVARTYTDLDLSTSLTCIPQVGTVDFEAEVDLPDPCLDVDCGSGTCVAVGGFATCKCEPGMAASLDALGGSMTCKPIVALSDSAGGINITSQWLQVETCKPPLPACGPSGWLVHKNVNVPGVACAGWLPPTVEQLTPPAAPNCDATTGANSTAIQDDDDLPVDPDLTDVDDGTAGSQSDESKASCRVATSAAGGSLFALLCFGWLRRPLGRRRAS